MVALLHRGGLKVIELIGLEREGYRSGSERLVVPSTKRTQQRRITLDSLSRQLLGAWVERRDQFGLSAIAPLFCSISRGTRGHPIMSSYIRKIVAESARAAGINKRVSPEVLRKTFARNQEIARRSGIGAYVNTEEFRSRYSGVELIWRDALEQYRTDPERRATTIGHSCREALGMFVREVARREGIDLSGHRGTRAGLRRLLSIEDGLGETPRRLLGALTEYCIATNDLVNRQEHGAKREKEPLTVEDTHRVLFYTMLVMYEVDRVFAERPRRLST